MESSLPSLLIVPPSPERVTDLCGVSLQERIRRVMRGLGFGEGTSLLDVRPTIGDVLKVGGDGKRVLVVFANFYYDERLLRAISEAQDNSVLIDSDPPPITASLWENFDSHPFGRGPCAAIVSREWLAGKNRDAALETELISDATAGRIALIDAALQPVYIPDMRRSIRPVFFPAPVPERRTVAERILVDATQKGVLDIPAMVHAPIEKWIVARLCRTPITPNQVTIGTGVVGVCVTVLYASGHLWVGALLALCIGILDGIDGKLARLKIQTTRAGKAEHVLDYFVEMSWWAALAYHFHFTGEVHHAYALWLAFYGCDLSGRMAKWFARQKIGRPLDDFSRFDRIFRAIAGRRNIYTWLFTFCLLIGQSAIGFVLICGWGIATDVTRVLRALQVRLSP